MDVARPPSFPGILFVTCCAWLCLRAVKAINSYLPLFNGCAEEHWGKALRSVPGSSQGNGFWHSLHGYNCCCLGCTRLSCATFSLKVPTPSCFVLPGTTRVQWSECLPVLASTFWKEEKCYCLISKSLPTGFLFTCCRGHRELCTGKAAEDTLFPSLWCLDHVWCSCRTL